MEANFAQGASDASLPMSPPRLISVIRAAMPEDGITCLDNGLYKVRALIWQHAVAGNLLRVSGTSSAHACVKVPAYTGCITMQNMLAEPHMTSKPA